jgi:glycosyltransferase involved in cell wall biosynthesis
MDWISKAGVQVEHIFSLDENDRLSKRYTRIDKLVISPNDCVVQAVNEGAKLVTGDVIIYLSDDFDCFPDWGVKITEICNRYKGEYMIKVDDGLQKFNNEVLTVPIMSRALYESLGYFFHPAYKSMWVDVDLYYTCARKGVIKFHKEILFQHNHYSNGKTKKDDTYTRSDGFWNQGKEVLAQRRRQQFA